MSYFRVGWSHFVGWREFEDEAPNESVLQKPDCMPSPGREVQVANKESNLDEEAELVMGASKACREAIT